MQILKINHRYHFQLIILINRIKLQYQINIKKLEISKIIIMKKIMKELIKEKTK